MPLKEVQIESKWKKELHEEFAKDYFQSIIQFLRSEKQNGKVIYPPGPFIFNAFEQTPFDKIKVVIIGQDPYHGPGQAMGVCFSVPQDQKIPPSLRNIYKEINQDVGCSIPNHGDLSSWAKQGIFLLNTVLTVEHKMAASHKKIGWQTFTDRVIQIISEKKKNIVFLLWGNYAKSKIDLINENNHYVLSSAHPSPLAGNRFFGHHHFSKMNELLEKHGKKPIDWQIK